jgi:hypothetical protein
MPGDQPRRSGCRSISYGAEIIDRSQPDRSARTAPRWNQPRVRIERWDSARGAWLSVESADTDAGATTSVAATGGSPWGGKLRG